MSSLTTSTRIGLAARARIRQTNDELKPSVRWLICAITTLAYFGTLPLTFRAFGDSAFDLLMLPIAAFAALWGLRVGLAALLTGAGLVSLWGVSAAMPLSRVLNVPHAVGGISLAIAFGTMHGVLAQYRRQGHELRRSHAAIRSIVESAPLILWAVDADGRFVVRDGKGLAAVGQTPGEWVGRSAREFCQTVYPECPELLSLLERALAGEETQATLVVRGQSEELHFGPIRDARGAVSGAVLTAIDVTERRTFEAHLERRALYDALTELPNRVLLRDRLELEIAGCAQLNQTFALVVADLDNFKDINDTFGHERGDEVLREVAVRLRAELRPTDTVARLGGDEFAILLSQADERLAANLVERVLQSFNRPLEIGGVALDLSASLGIAMYPAHGIDSLTLLRKADIAMYASKRTRRAATVYSADREVADPDALSLVVGLRDAITKGDIALAFQPEVRISDGALLRVEALARWTHPERGSIPPGRFIPLAERSGLIGSLTRTVLRDALSQAAAWRAEGINTVVAVNLSAHDLTDPALLSVIAARLDECGLSPTALALEITESVLMSDLDEVVRRLGQLRGLGISVAIDDFGTGYSSLSYLSRLPVDRVKIDRSFVARLMADAGARAIARAAVSIGHELGLHVVAEGVETHAQWGLLAEYGCDSVQGYYVSRPLATDAFARWASAAPDRMIGEPGVAAA